MSYRPEYPAHPAIFQPVMSAAATRYAFDADDEAAEEETRVAYRHTDARQQLLLMSASVSAAAATAGSSSSSSSSSSRFTRWPSAADGGFALQPVSARGEQDGGRSAGRRTAASQAALPPPALVSSRRQRLTDTTAFTSRFAEQQPHSSSLFAARDDGDGDDHDGYQQERAEMMQDDGEEEEEVKHGDQAAAQRRSLKNEEPQCRPSAAARSASPSVAVPASWMEMDAATHRLLQRAQRPSFLPAAVSDERLYWDDDAIANTQSRASSASASQQQTESERRERQYLHRLQQQQKQKRKGQQQTREIDLAAVSKAKRSGRQQPQTGQQPPPRRLSFLSQLELQLQPVQHSRDVADIEDAEPQPADSRAKPQGQAGEAAEAGRRQHEQARRTWKDELEAAIDTASGSSLQPALPHSRKGRRRGGLEERLEAAIRSRHSVVAIAQHRQQQQQLQHSSDALLLPDSEGHHRAVLLRTLAGAEFYSLLFTVCLLCSPYAPPPLPPYIPAGCSLSSPFSLSCLRAFAAEQSVPLSQLAVVVFTAEQRRSVPLPSADSPSASCYLLLLFPWSDVGARVGVDGRLLMDAFDCLPMDREKGEQQERKDAARRAAEEEERQRQREQEEQTVADGGSLGDLSESEALSAARETERAQRQQAALRAAFGDLSKEEIAALFQGAEDDEQREQTLLLAAHSSRQSLPAATPPPPPPAPPAPSFDAYRRLQLSELLPCTSLRHTAVVGIVRKTALHGHPIPDSASTSPLSVSPVFRPLLPCVWLDDGTAVVQVDIALSCLRDWSDVLLRGQGNVLWVGEAVMTEEPYVGRGDDAEAEQMLQLWGYEGRRGWRVMRVDGGSRWRMRQQEEQSTLPKREAAVSLTPLAKLLRGEKTAGRVSVHAKVLHMQWEADGSCALWLSDSSLMPPPPSSSFATVSSLPLSVAHCLPSTTVVVHFRHPLHLQLLRAFVHPDGGQGDSIIIQDLAVSTSSPCPVLTADRFTELLLPQPDVRCDVPDFQLTTQHQQAVASLRPLQRLDPFDPSVTLALATQLVPPLPLPPAVLPLSSLLTSDALLGPTASPVLQRYGLFSIDGVVMRLVSPASITRQCSRCGQEAACERDRRSPLALYCGRCRVVSTAPQPVVARLQVDMKCVGIVPVLRLELSPALVSSVLGPVLGSEKEMEAALLSKRLQCLCVCEAARAESVRVQELRLKAVDAAKDVRLQPME